MQMFIGLEISMKETKKRLIRKCRNLELRIQIGETKTASPANSHLILIFLLLKDNPLTPEHRIYDLLRHLPLLTTMSDF